MKTKLDKYFSYLPARLHHRHELIGGATTFATMAYIFGLHDRGDVRGAGH